jgi:hypothetical protein
MDELFNKIMHRIHKEQRLRIIRRRIAIFSVIFVASLTAFIPAFHALQKSITESGFMQFLSLLFSDFEIVVAYWQNFALSLLESLPVLNLIMFLAVVLALLESIKFLTKDIKFLLPQRTN